MTARDDYPMLAHTERYGLFDMHRALKLVLDEIDFLRRWRAEAVVVLDEWDRVWDAAGRPGQPGRSKAAAVLDWVQGRG